MRAHTRMHAPTQQAWYADDASASGSLKHLRAWWDELLSLGPAYGYNANALKNWLITKQQYNLRKRPSEERWSISRQMGDPF